MPDVARFFLVDLLETSGITFQFFHPTSLVVMSRPIDYMGRQY
jgi:hypothetical protein